MIAWLLTLNLWPKNERFSSSHSRQISNKFGLCNSKHLNAASIGRASMLGSRQHYRLQTKTIWVQNLGIALKQAVNWVSIRRALFATKHHLWCSSIQNPELSLIWAVRWSLNGANSSEGLLMSQEANCEHTVEQTIWTSHIVNTTPGRPAYSANLSTRHKQPLINQRLIRAEFGHRRLNAKMNRLV